MIWTHPHVPVTQAPRRLHRASAGTDDAAVEDDAPEAADPGDLVALPRCLVHGGPVVAGAGSQEYHRAAAKGETLHYGGRPLSKK